MKKARIARLAGGAIVLVAVSSAGIARADVAPSLWETIQEADMIVVARPIAWEAPPEGALGSQVQGAPAHGATDGVIVVERRHALPFGRGRVHDEDRRGGRGPRERCGGGGPVRRQSDDPPDGRASDRVHSRIRSYNEG